MVEPWTRERLAHFAAGREVVFYDRKSQSVTVPEWVLVEGATAGSATTGQRFATTHGGDRQRMVDIWWEATHHPGEVFEFESRTERGGAWVQTHTREVCLYDHPDVQAIVAAIEYGEVHDERALPEIIQKGEFEEVSWMIHTLDEASIIRATEGMVWEIQGRHSEDVIDTPIMDYLHPDGFDDALTLWMEIQNGPPGTSRTCRQRVLRPDGSTLWVEATLIKRVDANGIAGATCLVQDMTDRRRKEAALRTSQLEFRLLADQVPAAVFRADSQQRITFRNERWRQLFEVQGAADRLVDIIHPDDRSHHDRELHRLAVGRSDLTAAYEVRGRDGQRVYAISCRSVFDLVNESRSYVGSVTDITSIVKLRERAERDSLTGLWNRAATEAHLETVLAANPIQTAVFFIDLDGFKQVNDTYGHDIGDLVLQEAASRIRNGVRPEDVVGRFGGDEFVIVVEHAGPLVQERLMQRLVEAFDEPITWSGGSWCPAASIGVSQSQVGEGLADLIRRADHEMFEQKRQRKAAPG